MKKPTDPSLASELTSAQTVLRARARELARPPVVEQHEATGRQVVEFALAHERYAIEAAYVREALPFEDLTPLPCAPAFVRGLVNVRGRILPVIDLKRFLGLPDPGIGDLHRILVVSAANLEFGLLADVVIGIRPLSSAALQPIPAALGAAHGDYFRGVTSDRVALLDAVRLLSDPRLLVNEEIAP